MRVLAVASLDAELLAATVDAQATLRLWLSLNRTKRDRTRRHVARALECYPAWGSIKAAIVALLLHEADAEREAQAVPMRWAA